MPWVGEETIPKALGLPGYKALIAIIVDLINGERDRHAANYVTLPEVLQMIEDKMEEFKDDVVPG